MGWPVVTVVSGGISVTDNSALGYGIPVEEAVNGRGTAVTYVTNGGIAVVGGAGIRLSAASFTAGAAQGTAIGTLSVVGGTGTYTFTLTDSHTNAVQVAGTNGVNLQVGSASSSAGSFSITIHADNGAGSTFNRTFLVTATSVVTYVPTYYLLGF
jgi:hypothetical protein